MTKKEFEARVNQLEDAVRWALGEVGEFPGPDQEPPPVAGYRQRYFWRGELRQRAGLQWNRERERSEYVPAS